MWTLLALAILAAGGQKLVKAYERHLDAQVGPWITQDLAPQRIFQRRSARR